MGKSFFGNLVGKGENASNWHFLHFPDILSEISPLQQNITDNLQMISINPFPNNNILNWSKLKEFADDNFKFYENGGNFFKWVENTVENEKLLFTSNFSFSHSVFKTLVMQTRKNQGLFGKGLILFHIILTFSDLTEEVI